MAKLDRVHQKIFASTAPTSDVGVIGSLHEGTPTEANGVQDIQSLAAFEAGIRSIVIGENSPIIEEDNALYKLITYQLAYLFQNGIPEWSALVEYHNKAVVVRDGRFFFLNSALFPRTGDDPLSESGYWMEFFLDPDLIPSDYFLRNSIQPPLKYDGFASNVFATMDDEWTDVITVGGVQNRKGVHITFRSSNPSIATIIRLSAGDTNAWGEVRIIKEISGEGFPRPIVYFSQNIYVAGLTTPTFIAPGSLNTSDMNPINGQQSGTLATYKLQIKLVRNGATSPSFQVENLHMDIVGV